MLLKLVRSRLWEQGGSALFQIPVYLSVSKKPCPRAGWPLQLSGRENCEHQAAEGIKYITFLRTDRTQTIFSAKGIKYIAFLRTDRKQTIF